MAAQVLANHESQLEEAAFLRLASYPDLSLLRWLSAALCPTTSYQTGTGTVRNRQERRGGEVGCILAGAVGAGVTRLLLPWRGAGSRIARMQKLHSPPFLRTDA